MGVIERIEQQYRDALKEAQQSRGLDRVRAESEAHAYRVALVIVKEAADTKGR